MHTPVWPALDRYLGYVPLCIPPHGQLPPMPGGCGALPPFFPAFFFLRESFLLPPLLPVCCRQLSEPRQLPISFLSRKPACPSSPIHPIHSIPEHLPATVQFLSFTKRLFVYRKIRDVYTACWAMPTVLTNLNLIRLSRCYVADTFETGLCQTNWHPSRPEETTAQLVFLLDAGLPEGMPVSFP